jgi:CRISPR/Cas system type I-B associated protein Csh2 (Cas7 group RAMP superfamily)
MSKNKQNAPAIPAPAPVAEAVAEEISNPEMVEVKFIQRCMFAGKEMKVGKKLPVTINQAKNLENLKLAT